MMSKSREVFNISLVETQALRLYYDKNNLTTGKSDLYEKIYCNSVDACVG